MSQNRGARFLKGVTANTVGTSVSILGNFISLGIAVRMVSKEEFGVYVLLVLISTFFGMISEFGLDSATIRFMATGERQKLYYQNVLGLKMLLLVFAFVVAVLLKTLIVKIFSAEMLGDFYFYSFLIFASRYTMGFFQSVQIGMHRYKQYVFSMLTATFTRLFLIVCLCFMMKLGISGLIYALICSSLLGAITSWFSLSFFSLPRWDRIYIKELVFFGLPLQGNSFLAYVFNRIDYYMIGVMLSPVSIALYDTAYKIPEAVLNLFQAFRQIYFSNMAEFLGKQEVDKAARLMNTAVRCLALCMGFGVLVIWLFRENIVVLLFSKAYVESADVLFILFSAIAIGLCSNLLGVVLIANGSTKDILVPSFVESCVNIIGNVILIPFWGVLGAGIASFISRGAVNPIFIFLVRKRVAQIKVDLTYFLFFLIAGFLIILSFVFAKTLTRDLFLLLAYVVLVFVISQKLLNEDFLLIKQILSKKKK